MIIVSISSPAWGLTDNTERGMFAAMTGVAVLHWGNVNYQQSIGYHETNDWIFLGEEHPSYDQIAVEFSLGLLGIKKVADKYPAIAKPLMLGCTGYVLYWIADDFQDDNLAWKFKFTGREIPIIGWVIHELKGEWE